MGGPRRFKSKQELAEAWEAYKEDCNSQMVLTHEFSGKNCIFVSKELRRSVTYTIEGFCVFAGVSRAAFYSGYANNPKYLDIVTRMKEECEVDARKKFELGIIPTQLAPLWMSKHGYSVKADVTANESKENNLFEAMKESAEKIDEVSEIQPEAAGDAQLVEHDAVPR